MCGFAKQMIRVLGVAVMVAAPAAADQFSFGLSIGQNRGSTAVGVGFSWNDRPVVVAPVVTQPVVVAPVVAQPVVVAPVVQQKVWVPTVETTYRDVPVLDAFGRLISYRREAVQVQSGYWANVPAPAVVTGCTTGYVAGHGYKPNPVHNSLDKGRILNNLGKLNNVYNEWRDRNDHKTGGRDNLRYPATSSPRPVSVTRGSAR